MNILLINNDTKKLDQLTALLQRDSIIELTPMQITQSSADICDLIILSGNHSRSLIGNEHYFQKEIDLIQTTEKPVVGICFGLQIISYAYGGWVGKLPVKHHGIKTIKVVGHDDIFGDRESFQVYASHRWMVDKIDSPLIGLARSDDGWEIVRHETKQIFGLQFHPEEATPDAPDGTWLFHQIIKSYNKI